MLELINDYFCQLIIIVSIIAFTKLVFKRKVRSINMISVLILLIGTALITFTPIFDYNFIRTLFTCLLSAVVSMYVYKSNFYKSILYSIITMIFLTISEVIVFLLLTQVIVVSEDYLYNVFAGSVLSNVVIGMMAILLGVINNRWLRKLVNIKFKSSIVLYIVLLFLCLLFFFYITFTNIGNGMNLVFGIIAIIIIAVVITTLLVQAYRNNMLMMEYDKLLEFIKKYEIEIDNQRTMRHEVKNQLLTIKSKVIDNDENANIINYIDEIIKDNNKEINHTVYAKLGSLPPNGLKGLFYFKVSEAFDKGINVSINISKNISKSYLKELSPLMFNQLGKLLGILLDNAIESAELADNKEIGIEIYVVDDNVNFIISNTYVGKNPLTMTMGTRSTKGTSRGHGLLLAKVIVNSSNNFKLDTQVTDTLFIQKLVIEKTDNK